MVTRGQYESNVGQRYCVQTGRKPAYTQHSESDLSEQP